MRRFSGGLVKQAHPGGCCGLRRRSSRRPCWPSRPRRLARRSRRTRRRRTDARPARRSLPPVRASPLAHRAPASCRPADRQSGRHRRRSERSRAFPRDGATFLVLSTGDATQADQPDQPGLFPSVDDGGGPIRQPRATAPSTSRAADPVRQPDRRAAAALPVVRLPLPLGGVPVPARRPFNDAFIAEVDTPTVDDVGLRRSRRRTTSRRCRSASR